MPPTGGVLPFNQSEPERKVSVWYLDADGRRLEKQITLWEFQSFCIAWYAERNSPRQNHGPTLASTASGA